MRQCSAHDSDVSFRKFLYDWSYERERSRAVEREGEGETEVQGCGRREVVQQEVGREGESHRTHKDNNCRASKDNNFELIDGY